MLTLEQFNQLKPGDVLRISTSDDAFGDCIVIDVKPMVSPGTMRISFDKKTVVIARPYAQVRVEPMAGMRPRLYTAVEECEILPIKNHLEIYTLVSHGHTL